MSLLGDYVVMALLGALVFFPVVVAPTVFQALPESEAGTFLRKLFPRYYLFLITCSTAAAIFYSTYDILGMIICVSVTVSTVWVRQRLLPKINHFRDEQMAGIELAGRQFQKLHRLSVGINVLQMVALCSVVAL